MANIQTINSAAFDEQVLKAERPVLVDFYADWCGPCKAQTPVLQALSQRYEGRIDFVKVDVDRDPQLAQTYEVRSIPTLLLFNGGEQVDGRIGLNRKADLDRWLDEAA